MSNVAQQRRNGRIIRHRRVRKKIHGTAARPRLAVYRSNKHLVLQVIDDDAARTLVSASTNEPAIRFYRRLGFEVELDTPDAESGRTYGALAMSRRILPPERG